MKKKALTIIIIAIVIISYTAQAIHIANELQEIIFWNAGILSPHYSSDPELNSWLTTAMDYYYVREGQLPSRSVSLISHPIVIHWFFGAHCYYRYSVIDYNYNEQGEIDFTGLNRLRKGIHAKVSLVFNHKEATWEVFDYEEPLPSLCWW